MDQDAVLPKSEKTLKKEEKKKHRERDPVSAMLMVHRPSSSHRIIGRISGLRGFFLW